MRMRSLTPRQIRLIVELREGEEPLTIRALAERFSVSERTIYYVLAEWRRCEAGIDISRELVGMGS